MNKKVLITGASGFLAQVLLEKIHTDYSEIIITSRNSMELNRIEDKYSNVKSISGDLTNKDFVSEVVKDINLIFHLAAYKYVSLSEKNIMDSVNGNILATNNIFEAISKSNHPTDIKIVSTNKTHNIKGIYASTKYISERLARNYELEFDNINLSIIYLTNIFNSPGSISEIWKHAILNNQKLTVTDEKCTRFFLTKEQAVNLLIEQNIDHNLIKAVNLGNLLKALILKYNENYKLNLINRVGLKNTEHLHEYYNISDQWSNTSVQYEITELMNII